MKPNHPKAPRRCRDAGTLRQLQETMTLKPPRRTVTARKLGHDVEMAWRGDEDVLACPIPGRHGAELAWAGSSGAPAGQPDKEALRAQFWEGPDASSADLPCPV